MGARVQTRHIVLGLILLLALGFRVWGLGWGLYNANVSLRPHPDEWTVYWLFQWFGHNHNLNPCPVSGVGGSSSCFFDWGSVYLYLAYGVHFLLTPLFALVPMHVFGPHADPVFVRADLAGRVTSAVMSTATVVVVYRLGSVAYGCTAGLVAALVMALSGLLIQLAHFATPDSTTSFFVALALLAMLRAADAPSARRFVLAGAAIGLATGTEYHMALLLVPLGVAWLLARERRLVWLAGGGLCAFLIYLASNPYVLVDMQGFLAVMRHSILMRTVDSEAEYGERFARYGPSWLYVIRYPLGYGVGAGFTLWMMCGTVAALLRRRQADLVLLAWLLPYGVLVSLSAAKFMRYSAPLLPVLAVFSGALLAHLAVRNRPLMRLALAGGLSLTLAFTGAYDAAYAGLFSKPDARVVATRWLVHHASPGSRVQFQELPTGLVNLPYFVARAGFQPCFSEFQTQQLDGPISYILTDSYALEEHPIFSQREVSRFSSALEHDPRFRVAMTVHYTPSFLGMTFPIDGSPHDWRYADRDITVYKHVDPTKSPTAECFPDLDSAIEALYVHPAGPS